MLKLSVTSVVEFDSRDWEGKLAACLTGSICLGFVSFVGERVNYEDNPR